LVQGHDELRFYKSGFFKLATPFFGLSEPTSAERLKASKVRNS